MGAAARWETVNPERLVVLYDDRCDFCNRCRGWLERQPLYVPLEFVAGSAARRDPAYTGLPAGQELIVTADGGQVWTGVQALLMCLWATKAYRPLSFHLANRSLSAVTKVVYGFISANRRRL